MSQRIERLRDSLNKGKLPTSKRRSRLKLKLPDLSGSYVSSVQHISRDIVRHEGTSIVANEDLSQTSIRSNFEYSSTTPRTKRVRIDDEIDIDEVEGTDDNERTEVCEEQSNDQTAQTHLKQFISMQNEIQEHILSYEHPLGIDEPCECGHGPRKFRCFDCPWYPPVCRTCLLDTHMFEPFHWAEVWTGRCFHKVGLGTLGKRIYLGHRGQPCPAINDRSAASRLTVVDTNGIHDTVIYYCECSASVGMDSRVSQLLRFCLFPYTTEQPETAVTFRCLHDFQLHTHTSRKSVFDYVKTLYRRTSDEIRLNSAFISQHFIRLSRLWRFLAAERDSGQLIGIDSLIRARPVGSFAEICMACPIPGLNDSTSLNDASESAQINWPPTNASDKVRQASAGQGTAPHLNTIFLMIDGNFKLINLEKQNNLADASLWDGRGYFRARRQLEDHYAKHYNIKIEKGKCRKFAAVENANSLKYRGQITTGVIMVLCRHGLVRPDCAVNLKKGEKFVLADYGLQGALQNISSDVRRVVGYDIMCQYNVNLRQRWNIQFPNIPLQIDEDLIGKMHLQNHEKKCLYRHSFNLTEGVGRTDGEEAERFWAEANQLAGSTKQMNPGHRGDTLDDSINDYNRTKILQLTHNISRKYPKAKEKAVLLGEKFDNTDEAARAAHGDEVVDDWAQRGMKWEQSSTGQFESPFQSSIPEPSLQDQLQSITSALIDEKPNSSRNSGRLPIVITSGILLQQRQRRPKDASHINDDDIPHSLTPLRTDILNWRAHLYDICPKLHTFLDDCTVPDKATEINLCLPSCFSKEDRETFGLQHHAECELELRKGEAFDIIRNLRAAVRVISQYHYKKKQSSGTRSTNTRASKPYNRAVTQKRYWMGEYQAVRNAMLVLGLTETDKTFQPLTEKDLYRPENLEGVEFCAKEVGWLWTVSLQGGTASSALSEWEREDCRLQWIKQWAARDRWREEVDILEEELKRIARGCSVMAGAWHRLSVTQRELGFLGSASFAAKKEKSNRIVAFEAIQTLDKLKIKCIEEPSLRDTKEFIASTDTYISSTLRIT